MIVECVGCKTRFRLPDEKIRSAGTKVRCSRCRTTFVVHPPRALPELDEPSVHEMQTRIGAVPPEVLEALQKAAAEMDAAAARRSAERRTDGEFGTAAPAGPLPPAQRTVGWELPSPPGVPFDSLGDLDFGDRAEIQPEPPPSAGPPPLPSRLREEEEIEPEPEAGALRDAIDDSLLDLRADRAADEEPEPTGGDGWKTGAWRTSRDDKWLIEEEAAALPPLDAAEEEPIPELAGPDEGWSLGNAAGGGEPPEPVLDRSRLAPPPPAPAAFDPLPAAPPPPAVPAGAGPAAASSGLELADEGWSRREAEVPAAPAERRGPRPGAAPLGRIAPVRQPMAKRPAAPRESGGRGIFRFLSGVAVLLTALVGFVAVRNGGALPTHPAELLAAFGIAAGPAVAGEALAAVGVRTGRYPTRGGEVFFVRGTVQNQGAGVAGPAVRVLAELVDGERVVARGEAIAGGEPSVELLHELRSPADWPTLARRLGARWARPVEPGASLPFLVVLDAVPTVATGLRVRVTAMQTADTADPQADAAGP